ncbi:BamA/TamA family outer membrane protein [Paludibacteraceae bacterium OttesenSCG-928-F17]|nr:BamA/TamA family outer membrane protein [Paludibacteraceae bacterium OttesenSCG-928-F17]
MIRKLLLIFFPLFITVQLSAQTDSIVSKRSIFVIPHASYQQETSWAPGIAYGYYFKSRDLRRISSISGSVVYTFRHQFLVNIAPKIYFRNNDWYLYSNLNIRKYPNYYYGIGNKNNDIKQAFTSNIFSLLLQPQYEVIPNLFVGPNLLIRVEDVKTDSTFTEAVRDEIFNTYGAAGWSAYHQTSLGGVITYDTRDNAFYPYRGTFAKFSAGFAFAGAGSKYSVQQLSLDVRQYQSVFKNHVLAFQFKFDGVFGKNIPFQMLSTLGGLDVLRGFRENKYKDNIMMALQAEYRFPIFWRFRGTVFCAAGDVFDVNHFHTDKLKFTYGAGIRCRVNDARVHVRFDVAKNNYGDKLQFYITATESF